MNKRNKTIVATLVLLITSILIVVVIKIQPNEYEKNFEDNGRTDEPYKLNVPLHEMDFEEYRYCHPGSTAALMNFNRKVKLPCDVEYYASKEDLEPIIKLEKGTEVYVMTKGGSLPIGYGYQCWPDYDKGWRYGYVFLTEDFEKLTEDMEMYYVKSKQLEKVAAEFYEINENSFLGTTKKEYVKNITQAIDISLQYNGAYLSNYLIER